MLAQSDLRRHFPHPEAVSISSRSTLLLTGDCSGIVFNQLVSLYLYQRLCTSTQSWRDEYRHQNNFSMLQELDGTLVVRGAPGVKVEFNNAIVVRFSKACPKDARRRTLPTAVVWGLRVGYL